MVKLQNHIAIPKSIELDNYKPIILWEPNNELLKLIEKKIKVVEIINYTLKFPINNYKINHKIQIIIINKENEKQNINYNKDFTNIIKNELILLDKNENLNLFEKNIFYPHKIENMCYSISNGCWKINQVKIQNNLLDYHLLKLKNKYVNFKSNTYFPIFPNDSQNIFKLFNLKKYYSYTKFINLKKLRGIIWINKLGKDKKILKLGETPHYKYLNEDKEPYINYTNVDTKHSANKYDKLIEKIDKKYILENINYITIEVRLKENKFVICGGLHRACIYLKYKINYIRCLIYEN